MTSKLKSLYEITGNIGDVNTLIINVNELREKYIEIPEEKSRYFDLLVGLACGKTFESLQSDGTWYELSKDMTETEVLRSIECSYSKLLRVKEQK